MNMLTMLYYGEMTGDTYRISYTGFYVTLDRNDFW